MPRTALILSASLRNATIAPIPQRGGTAADVSEGLSMAVGPPKKLNVHRICLFGFDELKGNSLLASSSSASKGTNNKRVLQIGSHSDAELAEVCLPDGGHLRELDAVPIVFKTTSLDEDNLLFGYSVFRSIRDAREKRGAKQAALLMVSDSTGMDMFRPFLADALEILMTQAPWGDAAYWTKSLNQFRLAIEYGFNHSRMSTSLEDIKEFPLVIELWQRAYALRPPQFSLGDFGGASLKDLLKVFREKTMKLWYAVAAERRVVFVGQNLSASSVSNLVMAAPLLLGELAPFVIHTVEPYITLAVVDRIMRRRTFLCGTNNALFAQKTEWWDMCCDVTNGTIAEEFHSVQQQPFFDEENVVASTPPSSSASSSSSKLMKGFRRKLSSTTFPKPSQLATPPSSASSSCISSPPPSTHHTRSMGTEMAFVSRVLHDMDYHSEAWLRRQFHDFTLSFLNRVGRREAQADLSTALAGLFPGASIMQPRIVKFAEQFPQTSLWRRYRAKQDAIWGGGASGSKSETDKISSPSVAAVNSPSSSSSSSAMAIDLQDPTSFVGQRSSAQSLAPFYLESATGASQIPTGFVSVKDIVVPLATTTNLTPRASEKRASGKMRTEISFDSPRGDNLPKSAGVGRWIRVSHENGEPYYWNTTSGETKWELSDDELL